MTVNERIQIITDLRSKNMTAKEISDKYKTKIGVIQWINRDVKKGAPGFAKRKAK